MRAKLRQRKKFLKGFAGFCHNIMEKVEKEGKKDLEEQKAIREYLLGALSDKAEMRRIEEKILLDDEFVEELLVAEDQLIDEFLDGTLSASEQKSFDQYFLNAPERKQKLRLIRDLRRYAAGSEEQTVRQFSKEKKALFDWRRLISLPAFRLGAASLLILLFGFIIWRAVFHQSDVDEGLAQLQIAYRGQRPTESRSTANFDYAPVTVTRGNDDVAADEDALRLAELILAQAAKNSADAESHHALGLVFLADKKFDKASAEFNLALNLAPKNARIHSDLGAALFEQGKKALLEKDGAKGWEFLDQSLKHLESAIALDPKLLEPRFNRALCLEALSVHEQAKQAWREYLELDSNSKWAEEARQHLQTLESQKTEDRSAAELERDFLIAAQGKNEEKAWQLLSRNRELIREKYLPQRLAMSFLEASGDEKKDFLAALEYAGELEKIHIGDSFASEIAQFYAALPESKIDLLRQAQQAVRNGYELCLKLKYGEALDEFNIARDLFSQADNIWENKLSEYFIGYCLINNERVNDGITQLEQIVEFSQNQNYKWLKVTSLHWVAGGFIKARQFTKAKKMHEKTLALAEEIDDSYAIQRNLLGLANLSSFIGQKRQALNYLQRVLTRSSSLETSFRQKYRNYSDAHQILTLAKLYNVAKSIALESVRLADEYKKDEMFMVLSRSNAGIAYFLTENFTEARNWLAEGRKKAEAIADKTSREKMLAHCFLKFGYLERQAGNYEKSEQFYKESLKLYAAMKMPFHEYEAQKGKLLTYLANGKNAELVEQIPVTLKLIEDYRNEILEEREKIIFFDTEQSIYDIAADFEYGRSRYEEAYNYTEISNSRSLLDWLQKGAKISGDDQNLEILLEENANPLTLTEIRERMPEQVQILQFSVLENKILIWLVSKEKFVVVPVSIQSIELRKKVENYVDLLKRHDEVAQENAQQLARELYDLLISPISNYLDPAKKICLIPSKVLFYLPFAALISPNEKPFLADFDIFYSSSANVFLFCTENAQKKVTFGSETLLSVGNPAFEPQFFDNLPDLPEAENEAREIRAFYDNRKILLRNEATKTAFKNSMRDADIIHFAGHYVVVHDKPLSSHLVLAQNGKEKGDSILANSELVGEKLTRTKLVILSACQTGVEHYYNGEGLIGLSRTFLAAGAPLVIASQWRVETEATAKLMKRFHFFRRQEKMNTTAALRKAQLEMLDEPTGRFRKPYYWAGFAAFGGYANF